jgi:CubicO group peptidase (beta-lactamase class C family)
LTKHKTPGAAVALIDDNRVVWRREFGVKQAGATEPVSSDTVFEACSMSKPLFAYAFLKLVENGEFKLDQPLAEYLKKPYLPDEPLHRKITARMVLTHTTGFPNWRKGGWRAGGPIPVKFEPGSEYGYSGEGFWYLQQVVENVVAEQAGTWMQSQLIKPLRMDHSSYTWQPEYDAIAAAGHDPNGAVKKDRPHFDRANAAFTLYTTPSDYAQFLVEIMGADRRADHSLSAATIRTMLKPTVDTDTPGVMRSLGWAVKEREGAALISHSGSNGTGFRCYAEFEPARRRGLVVMTNGVNGAAVWKEIVTVIEKSRRNTPLNK